MYIKSDSVSKISKQMLQGVAVLLEVVGGDFEWLCDLHLGNGVSLFDSSRSNVNSWSEVSIFVFSSLNSTFKLNFEVLALTGSIFCLF